MSILRSAEYCWKAKLIVVVLLINLACSTKHLLYAFSADEAQAYNFTGNTLAVTPENYKLNESAIGATDKPNNSGQLTNANLEKHSPLQMDNGFIHLTDDTRVWITPSGAALNVKY